MVAEPAAETPGLNDIRTLIVDWGRHLRARNRAPRTIDDYLACGRNFAGYLVATSRPTDIGLVTAKHHEDFFAHEFERGISASTVAKHYRSLQQLWKWLEREGEIDRSPMALMSPPAVPEQPVPVFTDDELRRLLEAAKGTDFDSRRDTAVLRLLIDTGIRLAELAGLDVDDLDFDQDVAHVMGKGRRGRSAPFGAKTTDALRRYLRARARHPKAAGTTKLWLGKQGAMTPSGIAQILDRLSEQSGVQNVHPHRFRHTFAHDWLDSGGQETDLMRLAGWKSRQMVGRYAASAASERARRAHRRAARGDRI